MFKDKVVELLVKESGLEKSEVEAVLESPPSLEMGDYAFPCFVLSKPKSDEMWERVEKDFFEKKSPVDIAKHLAGKIKVGEGIESVRAVGPYVNFFIDKKELARKVIKIKSGYGKGKESGKIMIEFSQPNTHKAFHVGHIRGTTLGESLSRIYEFLGKKVVRANYNGDTGMHIAKWIWCYLKYHSKEKLKDDEEWIASIYVDAVKRLAKNEKLQKQVDEINRKIEEKSDKSVNALWKKTRGLSIKSWDKIYSELGTKFDRHYFESEMEMAGKSIAQELLKKGVAEMSDEAIIMNLEKYKMGVWVLLRRDGTVLYSAKDLALVEHKLNDSKLDEYIIISGDEQNLHFRQLFKTLELMGIEKRDEFKHLGFGMVRLPHGKMSSRTGDNILYSNFKEGVTDFARKGVLKKWKKLSKKEVENRALKIAIGSIKYSMLSQDPHKTIIFDKEKALAFEGNSGVYLQYSYARASSILKKGSVGKVKIGELGKEEIALMSKISKFPEVVLVSGERMNPSLIANYCFELAKVFNEFYHECKVVGSDSESFRLKLIESFRVVLRNGLGLLGIEVMDEM
ncbi:arginine--tRNA ligase [archaeon]|nr:arginine--tRNA ligase [archaeon]